jgi:hypothetical protein
MLIRPLLCNMRPTSNHQQQVSCSSHCHDQALLCMAVTAAADLLWPSQALMFDPDLAWPFFFCAGACLTTSAAPMKTSLGRT